MSDMEDTVIPKSDQLNADDLIGGKTMTITITRAKVTKGDEQPCVLWYKEGNAETKKPYKPGKSMRRVLMQVWGKDSQQYVGKSLTLYCDPTVKFGGVEVGGIRISHMSHLNEKRTLALTATRGNKKPFVVQPLKGAPQAETQQQAATPPAVDPAVKTAGDAAAAKGVADYTAWLGTLAPEVKETVRALHKDWSAKAKAADEAKAKPEDEIPFGDDAGSDDHDDTPEM